VILENSGMIIAQATATADPLGLSVPVAAGPVNNKLFFVFASVDHVTGVSQLRSATRTQGRKRL